VNCTDVQTRKKLREGFRDGKRKLAVARTRGGRGEVQPMLVRKSRCASTAVLGKYLNLRRAVSRKRLLPRGHVWKIYFNQTKGERQSHISPLQAKARGRTSKREGVKNDERANRGENGNVDEL